MPADFSSSSNVSFLTPDNLLVLRSVMDSLWLHFCNQFGDWKDFVPLEVLSVLLDSVPFVILRGLFLYGPGDWRCWACRWFVLMKSSRKWWPFRCRGSSYQLFRLRECFQFVVVEQARLCCDVVFLYSCRATRRKVGEFLEEAVVAVGSYDEAVEMLKCCEWTVRKWAKKCGQASAWVAVETWKLKITNKDFGRAWGPYACGRLQVVSKYL